ncbi:MIF4G domain-containing protein isoform X1 [Parus major]|uniref:MIF4G domain-containing protein isoform X1 n=1 Tax=Parus major TaxID=9157 RepID=UPI0014446E2E|nr:MIF4G domain-containing protein isoform X1 [Parus major]XP_033374656.1 MIF4G domain-containing protein isoform X1 [Parus major]XP_033374657.1 MIF4G domain-containing protein isoform X1 [Parus major]XP_033374658.1 MIF4G domain-containing protein isoform X1 [Parus major]XP_033374659.1 MIF4G domain-containing protein isoform X1 [Parus major]
MGETGKEEYKIQSFDSETQKLLKTALKGQQVFMSSSATQGFCTIKWTCTGPCKDLGCFPGASKQSGAKEGWVLTVFLFSAEPSNVDLEKVANIIVDQSLKDSVFSKEAGRICYTIIQAESKQVGQSIFRRSLLNRLQQEYKDREELRTRSLQAWICYVTFICNIFDYLRVNNMPMMALVNPVYDCLFRLAQPDSLQKEEEVDCLVLQLHRIGEQLEKMNSQRMDELFSLLRDGFLLQEGLSSLSQLLLLEIIEFRAADWKMTDAAQKYYYSEVTD